ncbi:hypothetical protein EIP91_005852 [Steccherinum ochraceum]|uniref:Uncharacterized protein n=1 Tax=Steccherinum ochraceum TaxID=92696 RepID=A0A4R0RCK3_9APHY|nr:hypothetical protein EIP91_005852 [Steccherinum ochraceum]
MAIPAHASQDEVLASLPSDFWTQQETIQLIVLALLGAWVWDVLLSLHDEYCMFRRSGIRLPDIVYILAKVTTGWFFGVTVAFLIAPIHDCHTLARVQSSSASIQIPINALLFLFRIRAVFHNKRPVIFAFVVLWLGLLGTSMSALLSLDAKRLPGTDRCLETTAQKTAAAAIVYGAVYDTLVFIAISTQLVLFYQHAGRTWKVFLTGRGMGDVSRILLQTTQLYYLVTVGFTIFCSVLVLTPSVPHAYSNTSILLNAFITNVMATRIYRHLKKGPAIPNNSETRTMLQFGWPRSSHVLTSVAEGGVERTTAQVVEIELKGCERGESSDGSAKGMV